MFNDLTDRPDTSPRFMHNLNMQLYLTLRIKEKQNQSSQLNNRLKTMSQALTFNNTKKWIKK